METGYRSNASLHDLFHLHKNFCIEGEIEVDSGSEFYETEMTVDRSLMSATGVSDDPSGHGSGYLAGHYPHSGGGKDPDSAPLVLGACLGEIGRQEAPAVMSHILHLAVDRIPVGMDVEGGHEHGKHYGIRFEIFRLEYFLYGHDMPVDGAHHHVSPFSAVVALGAAEEIENKKVANRGDGGEYCREGIRGHKQPYGDVYGRKHEEKKNEDIGAFSVYLHYLWIL